MTGNNRNSAIAFLQWWQRGLALPWRAAAPKPQLLSYESSQWRLEPENKAIDLNSLDAQDVYFCAPADKVIRTQIPVPKRGDLLGEVAVQLLPFAIDELYLTKSADNSRLFAILRADIKVGASELVAAGLRLVGLAFKDNSEFYICATEHAAVKQIHSPAKLLAGVFGTGILLAALATSFAWRSQVQQQNELNKAISALSADQLGAPTSQHTELVRQVSAQATRDSVAVSNSLAALVAALPIDGEIQYLILTESELVIDAHASNAAMVKAALEKQDAFFSSEFVTAISADTSSANERFRLKASLKPEVR